MNTDSPQPACLTITRRTALWSWTVTVATLLAFATVIIPQQKRIFQDNLESKAHGVAVSLRDVAAGSVVNEDFSSVVDHCKEMLKGDPALDFIVITKNDGFSLINDRAGWRTEAQVGPEWRPAARKQSSGLGVVPLFNRRVFHYSQPFDYSGIEWGWIHVGLSLERYDRSVAMVYQRTTLLAVGCILFSLAASVFQARRLVRPILALRNVVQRVAGGDLTVRAEVTRGDELGTLAGSVNSMTEALLRRDQVLQSVRYAAQQFLSAPDWRTAMGGVLAKLGSAAQVSRIRVYEIQRSEAEGAIANLSYEWTPHLAEARAPSGEGTRLVLRGQDFPAWSEQLRRRETITAQVSDLTPAQRILLEPHGFQSIMVIPIMVQEILWGLLTLAECEQERQWSDVERDSLRAAADMLSAAIERQRAQDALLEAKATLEQRVKDRTRELEEQVAAREKAHTDLAEAQQQLIETSRLAGKAEVATGVLHNVGNVLNSINVSCTLVSDRVRQSKVANLPKIAEMIKQQNGNLAAFLTGDPKGRQIPGYLCALAPVLVDEQAGVLRELQSLRERIDHIKEIVSMQQSYARISGVTESMELAQLVEDAIKLNTGALARHGVTVQREYETVPPLITDKHKVLQILLNVIRNAKYAMDDSGRPDKRMILRIGPGEQGRVLVQITDNGVGIPAENLTRIFAHGFSTRKDGHGFGLHSGALAARELGGSLIAESPGPGQGATFTLELPIVNSRKT